MFWAATPAELFMAITGHNRKNGAGDDPTHKREPMTRADFQALAAKYPDGGSIRDS